MKLTTLAKGLKEDLGYSYQLRLDYLFAVPEKERLSVRRADAVIFASPVPSIQTATIGFTSFQGSTTDNTEELSAYAYLGAPLLVASTNEHVSLYEFQGSPLAKKVDEQPLASSYSNGWLRERLLNRVESPQLGLSFGTGKDLLIQDTRTALSDQVSSLVSLIRSDRKLDDVQAFRVAMAVTRQISLGQSGHENLPSDLRGYARALASRLKSSLSLANIPPESVAELYETFAVGPESRRKKGIVFTPSWLARYVISRLPQDAFRSGAAVDPTCGSGTFLVCFLERFVEERARIGKAVTSHSLKQAVTGIDNDPVAIEASRLSLDFFCNAINKDYPNWNLLNQDATSCPVRGEWVIGNLPFGYRTHEGKHDISTIILENIENTNDKSEGLSIILPDSLAYTAGAAPARELLRSHYQIQEITRLPKSAFDTTVAMTMVVVGRKGQSPREVVVREVSSQDLRAFRVGSYVSKTYVSRFAKALRDPWRFSPFNNEFERAERLGVPLKELATVHIGLQIYGKESKVLSNASRGAKPLLTEPAQFLSWTDKRIGFLPRLSASRLEVRRPGPWELFDKPKVIVRVTTEPGSDDRLAAVTDHQGVWFTDKFAGIWTKGGAININAIAAYLQTRFARLWFDVNNPSRKLRKNILDALPVPELPSDWWKRGSVLAESNTTVHPISIEGEPGFEFTKANAREWDWFNSIVEAALGFEPSVGATLEKWLLKGSS